MITRSLLGPSLLLLAPLACTTDDPEPPGDGTGSTSASDTSASDTSAGDGTGTTGAIEPPGEPMYCPGVPEWGYPVCRTQDDCEAPIPCVPAPDDCPGPGCSSDCTSDGECVDFLGKGMNGVCTFPYTGCCAS
jgi:hypothetical protein